MIAYFDCFSGISGDMTLGAFTDLGVPVSYLKDSIRENLLDEFDISMERKSVNGIDVSDISVIYDRDSKHKRNYGYIKDLIEKSTLSENVKENSLSMFREIALAESKIHGTDIEKTHFHEVGSVDAIVDIVGVCLCIDYLKISKVYSSHLPLGSGFVKCSHGVIPVPAPATCEILKGVPLKESDVEGELVTPTGASIIKVLADQFSFPSMAVEKIGYGSGKKRFENWPNLLRVMLGRESNGFSGEDVFVIESQIDDMNPEIFGFLMEKLLFDGALDVYYTPVFMKKNRPGTKLTVITEESLKDKIIKRILTETSTTGVRFNLTKRATLKREVFEFDTSFGKMRFKRIERPDGTIELTPEFEDCRKVSLANGIALKKVYETVLKQRDELLKQMVE